MKCLIEIDYDYEADDIFKGYVTLVIGNILKLSYIAILENPHNNKLSLMMPRYISDEKDEDGEVMNKEIICIHSRQFRNELMEVVTEIYKDKKSKPKEININSIKSLNKYDIKVKIVGKDIKYREATLNFDNIFSINNIKIKGIKTIIMPTYKVNNGNKYKMITSEICNFIDKKIKRRVYIALAQKNSICWIQSIIKLI